MPMPKKPRANCLACKKEVPQPSHRYCNNRCQNDHRYRSYIERWKAGLESGVQAPYGVSNHIRRYLVAKYGECCRRCGWAERNPVTGRVPLNIEHIDGRRQNCREDNLMLLCPNCHSLTPTFGALNRGNGRAARYRKMPS